MQEQKNNKEEGHVEQENTRTRNEIDPPRHCERISVVIMLY